MLFNHTILLDNDFVVHKKFIALHYAAPISEDFDVAQSVIQRLKNFLGNDAFFSAQCLTTESASWQSVVDYDPYFRKMYNIEYDGDRSLAEFTEICRANKILHATDIAKLVLSRVECTQLKLQKLVYFCFADYLEKTGKQLFAEHPVAYKYGPVFKSLRIEYGSNDDQIIIADRSVRRQSVVDSRFLAADKTLGILRSCLETIDRYGGYSPSDLINLTHKKDSPWSFTYDPCCQKIIPNELIIKQHYVERV